MCPQSPSPLVAEYRREQRLLLNKEQIDSIQDKIKRVEKNAKESTNTGLPNPQQKKKCDDFIDKLKECKFCTTFI